MTRARVTAQQTARPPKSARLMRGTVAAVSPLTVQIAGGAAVKGLALPGQVYNVGDAVLVAVQEPAVGAVYPLTPTPPPDLSTLLPKTAISGLPYITNLDTAPDGFAFCPGPNSPVGISSLVETYTSNQSGTVWRFQRVTGENGYQTSIRRQWAGSWLDWTTTPSGYRQAAVLSWRGSQDIPMADNGWTNIPFDTVAVDHLGLNLATGSNSVFAVPLDGYYRISARFALTNFIGTASGFYLKSTIYNQTQNQDHFEFHGWQIPAGIPMSNHAPYVYARAGDRINAAVFKASGAGSNWLSHGSGSELALAPQIAVEYMGAV